MSKILRNLSIYNQTPNTITGGTLYTAEVNICNLKEDQNRLVRIYLPSNYDKNNPSLRFPVLYMMDGKNLFDKYTSFIGEWQVDEIMEERYCKQLQTYIVVGIDSACTDIGRVLEMLPDHHHLNNIDNLPSFHSSSGGVLAEFIAKKLKPEIDKTFFTLQGKNDTAIAGSSMGGLFSFYTGIKYYDIFGMIISFSPAFCLYEENYFIDTLLNSLIQLDRIGKIYLLVGNLEYENQFVYLTKKAYEILLTRELNSNQIKFIHDLNGVHHESFWSKYLNDALEFWSKSK